MQKLKSIFYGLMAVFLCILAGCSGGAGDTTDTADRGAASGTDTPTPVQLPDVDGGLPSISGTISFDRVAASPNGLGLDYSNVSVSPVRSVKVELVDHLGEVLSSTITDANGAYQFTNVPENSDVQVRVLAGLTEATNSRYSVKIVDNTQSYTQYALTGALSASGENGQAQTRDLHAGLGGRIDDLAPRPAGPFAILDTIYTSLDRVLEHDSTLKFPELRVHWSVNNRPDTEGGREAGGLGGSFYTPNVFDTHVIGLLGHEGSDTDEYDTHVVAHEFSHFLEQVISRSDSLGGPHALNDALDPRLAFSEGLANAMAAIFMGSSVATNTLGRNQSYSYNLDWEDNDFSPAGWYNEATIASVIYDIYDSASPYGDSDDVFGAGIQPILKALTNDTYQNRTGFITIFSFTEALADLPEINAAALAQFLSGRGINSIDSEATNETNDAGNQDILPLYKKPIIGGTPIRMCSTDAFGTQNKLGVAAFGVFDVSQFGQYAMEITPVEGDILSAPQIYLFSRGDFVDGFVPARNGSSYTSLLSLYYDSYAFTIEAGDNVSGNGTRVCYDVSIRRVG